MTMDMNGSERIEAPVEVVWRALNDAEILRQCIPGCERLDKASDTEMSATVVLKIGPVKARFEGAVELSNLDPPHSYTISGEGKGGLVGFAKGGADVSLTADGPQATILTYTVKADVGGKIAQLGSRLIDSTAKKLAAEFFSVFGEKAAGHALAATDAG
ncbi:carbon monoxide dehydrogenase [Metarhizobium album]|uniref:Carbon monoxide dehydrogenase n=1 Tax=Metarhizobium album TaxID=2182425 RepID=A0A2U2DLQ4_9HYPH|nr:carbon monoxide dehydrogenase subunit G [Rhizobium album]PWE54237.1 carbon monoxide dehydrogenase [Rhizobium album]